MDREESWRVITEQRLGLARLLEGLSDDEWEQPSLCAGWRVRDVAAHVSLIALPPSPGTLLVDLLRARGSFHRLNTMASRRRAERAPNQLIADLRQHAGSRKIPIVSDQRNVLFDLLVHVQDIAIPLGVDLPMPLVPAAAGATRVWSMGWPFWARRQLRGLRLRATDTNWSAGAGAELRGPIGMLLLLLTGRTMTALPHLSGPGVQTIIERAAIPGAEADQS
ncbi:MAG: maleylpyruvate isomerase family mycothiol-dependent enzyme [Propionibacteriaceae bacterium]|jgi:uncharacterized protein (TIGR03083 family)|nr:maleylpyruvate isomerase family mycothiol-dependent enzyme [Propionibacteriaceae bacterium]